MEEITKMKVDWKKITVVGALVILTAITIGGLTWYVATAGAQDELEAYKNDIVRLETEVAQLKAEEAPKEETATTTETDKNTEWKTYSIRKYGTSFNYPAYYKEIKVTENGNAYTVSLSTDKLVDGKIIPHITMMINPDGFGPIFTSTEYDITVSDGKLTYTKMDKTERDEYTNDGSIMLVGDFKITRDEYIVMNLFKKTDTTHEYQKDFEKILDSFYRQ